MTTMSHDDARPTAVEDALAELDAPRAGTPRTRPGGHLAAVDSIRPSGTRHTPVRAPAPGGGTPDASHRRLRLVPTLAPARPRVAPATPAPPLLTERVRRIDELAHARAAEAQDDRGAAPRADAGRFAHGVGLACVEVVLGRRPAQQLVRWVTTDVLESLQERADLVRRAGVLTHARRPVARRVRVCPVAEHAAEVCLVVDDGVRVRAVALRLEAWRGAWRVTTLEIG